VDSGDVVVDLLVVLAALTVPEVWAVTTISPSFRPLVISVVEPSVNPVTTGFAFSCPFTRVITTLWGAGAVPVELALRAGPATVAGRLGAPAGAEPPREEVDGAAVWA
jgi:hypothetical protein